MTQLASKGTTFHLLEATIADIHAAYQAGTLSARELTQLYLDRIAAFDRAGPEINAIITIAPDALKEAERLDVALKHTGPVGPLHGIPVVLKDQMDAVG